MSQSRVSGLTMRIAGVVGAAAWLAVAIAWQASNVLERTRPWEGLPRTAYLVGAAALIVGSVALALTMFHTTEDNRRQATTRIGFIFLAVGLIVSVIAGWAIPIWAGLYGVAVMTLTRNRTRPRVGWLIGGAFLAAPVAMFVLTALRVGQPDSYGDYPIAWSAATWVACLGAAAGMALLARTEPAADRTRLAAGR